MRTRESEEMYLETIYLLSQKKETVHSVDIGEELGYAKSSVSRGVNLLQKKGLLTMDRNGDIRFTDAGLKKAGGIYERHGIITEALKKIGANEEVAEHNACRIEHVITDELVDVLRYYVETGN